MRYGKIQASEAMTGTMNAVIAENNQIFKLIYSNTSVLEYFYILYCPDFSSLITVLNSINKLKVINAMINETSADCH